MENMKLQLKHLAPYLAYGLKMQFIIRDVVEKTGTLTRITHDQELTHPTKIAIDYDDSEHIWMFKSILRPMSDLVKEDFLNLYYQAVDEKTDDSWLLEAIEGGHNFIYADFQNLTYRSISFLFEHHFDVFGLIDAGLAIDINTIQPCNK